MRCFVSVEFEDSVLDRVQKIQEMIRPQFTGKLTERANLHLTLKFLGEIDAQGLEIVARMLAGVKSSKLRGWIDSIGVFSRHQIRIIWLKVNGTEILQNMVDASLRDRFSPETQYMGHLTIARPKKVDNACNLLESLDRTKIEPIHFSVNRFFLKESTLTPEGAIYRTIRAYEL